MSNLRRNEVLPTEHIAVSPEQAQDPSDRLTGPIKSVLIDGVLNSLRGQIRRYVLIHGLMLALIWLVVSFWIVLALDYGPVLAGFSEMSRGLRLILLSLIISGLGWILYRWVFCRVRRRLRPQSLALLLEDRFPQLNDALATVIQDPVKNANDELADLIDGESMSAKNGHRKCLTMRDCMPNRYCKKLRLPKFLIIGP